MSIPNFSSSLILHFISVSVTSFIATFFVVVIDLMKKFFFIVQTKKKLYTIQISSNFYDRMCRILHWYGSLYRLKANGF